MKISIRQLRALIKESLNEDDNNSNVINLSMDVPEREGYVFSIKAKGNDVDAFFEEIESGKTRKLSNNPEDKTLMLGVLCATLPTAKPETKSHLLRLLARLTGESEKEEDMVKLDSKIQSDKKLSSYVLHIKDPKVSLV